MQYHDMIIEAGDLRTVRRSTGGRLVQFSMRVLASPAGEMRPEEAVPVEYAENDVLDAVQRMRQRTLSPDELAGLGQTLGLLLLPPAPVAGASGVRELFVAARSQLSEQQGLRLRIRLPALLEPLPWELALVARTGQDAALGFLALDPQVAIVRHEELAAPAPAVQPEGQIELVAALASPPALPPLDLAVERAAIEQAVAGASGIAVQFVEPATRAAVEAALPGAEIFHFAGHSLAQNGGALALDDGRWEAGQLAQQLRLGKTRIALLGGCDTGQRDANLAWNGVAATLVRAEVPAVVAYQMTIDDGAAIVFSRQFYTALVAGMPIEYAVAAGRLAAYNREPTGREWATPVLYMRAAEGQLFGGNADAATRADAAKTVQVTIEQRFEQIGDSTIVGARIGKVSMSGAQVVNIHTILQAGSTGDDAHITGVEIGEI